MPQLNALAMPLLKLFLLGFCLAVAGCSYRPLYGTSADGQSVAVALSGISIEEQKERTGQLVRNELVSSLGPSADGTSRYMLKLEPVEKTINLSSLPGQKLERKRYRLNVKYVLVSTATGQVAQEGASFATVSYDTVLQPIADLQAAENARVRATREVAEDIRLRLAAFLSAKSG